MSIASRDRQRKTNGWKRSTGGKHRWKRMAWMPYIVNGIARLKDGAAYFADKDGWRRAELVGGAK